MKSYFECKKCEHKARTVFKVKIEVTAKFLLSYNYLQSFDLPRHLQDLDQDQLVGFYCKRCGCKYDKKKIKKFLRTKRIYLKLTNRY